MAVPSRTATKARVTAGAVLGLVVGVVTAYFWNWDLSGSAVLVLVCAGVGYYAMLWTVIMQTALAAEKAREEDEHLRNVPVGL